MADGGALEGRPGRRSSAWDDTGLDPVEMLRQLGDELLIKDEVGSQSTILIGSEPRPTSRFGIDVFRVCDGSNTVSYRHERHSVTNRDDLPGGVIPRNAIGVDRPRVSSVSDVGVAVVECHSVDLDQNRRGVKGEREVLCDELHLGCPRGEIVGSAPCLTGGR